MSAVLSGASSRVALVGVVFALAACGRGATPQAEAPAASLPPADRPTEATPPSLLTQTQLPADRTERSNQPHPIASRISAARAVSSARSSAPEEAPFATSLRVSSATSLDGVP